MPTLSRELASRIVHTPSRSVSNPSNAAEKLALAEVLLAELDPRECVDRCLTWLRQNAAVSAALCLGFDDDPDQLVVLSHAKTAEREWSVSMETPHPLREALYLTRPMQFRPEEEGFPETPLGHVPFLALPLRGLAVDRAASIGLLLIESRSPQALEPVLWVAEVLGQKLANLQATRSSPEAEQRLERERFLLQRVINAVPDPILLTDSTGRMVVANTRAEQLFVVKEKDSPGRRRAIELNNMFFSAALSERALAEVEPTRREVLLADPSDGSDLLLELLSSVSYDPRAGSGVVSILRNINDLRRAAEEIEENYRKLKLAEGEARAERDRLDLIINSVVDPILVTDPSGNIELMNTPAERLFTVDLELQDQNAQRAVRSNDARFSSLVSNLFVSISDGQFSSEIGLLDPRTGATLPFEAISGKILSGQGQVSAIVTILHDQSEAVEKAQLYEQIKRSSLELEAKVREATAELLQRNELLQRQHIELEQASLLKSRFLANVSHEFRTPLNAILGYTQMLLQGVYGELAVPQRKHLSRVDANGRHLLTLISDILDISKIEAGKMPLRIESFDLSDLVAELLTELAPLLERSSVKVSSEIFPKVPRMRTDRQKLKQVLSNLLTNALKFTSKGSIRIRASFSTTARRFSISVIDTGIGIAEGDRERVFEDFRQVDSSSTRQYGGAGLGLSICRRLVAMLGGEITLSSQVSQGSTFKLSIPNLRKSS